jgi:hypothetical protein
VGEDGFMTDKELSFCALCGPLEDAIEMMDSGNMAGARAVMKRVLAQAQELCDQEKSGG